MAREILQSIEANDLQTALNLHRSSTMVMDKWVSKIPGKREYEINLAIGNPEEGVPHYLEVVVCSEE